MNNPGNSVHPQITDGLTQVTGQVLGTGPVVALLNTYMGQAQAQAVLAANMVNQQQQQALVSIAVTMRNVRKLLGGGRAGSARSAGIVTAPPAAPNSAPHDASASAQGPGNLPVW